MQKGRKFLNSVTHLNQIEMKGGPTVAIENTVLTIQERVVGSYMVNGLTTKEISNAIHRSINTIKQHKRNIQRKLNCRNCCQTGYKLRSYLEPIDEI